MPAPSPQPRNLPLAQIAPLLCILGLHIPPHYLAYSSQPLLSCVSCSTILVHIQLYSEPSHVPVVCPQPTSATTGVSSTHVRRTYQTSGHTHPSLYEQLRSHSQALGSQPYGLSQCLGGGVPFQANLALVLAMPMAFFPTFQLQITDCYILF